MIDAAPYDNCTAPTKFRQVRNLFSLFHKRSMHVLEFSTLANLCWDLLRSPFRI